MAGWTKSALGLTAALAVLGVLAACGSDDGSSDGAAVVECAGTPPEFPSFERGCSDNAACIIAVHQTSCCGDTAAIGLNHSERKRFDDAESKCRSQYPGCGCPQGPTVTDTGQSTTNASQILVECRSGTCTTFLP